MVGKQPSAPMVSVKAIIGLDGVAMVLNGSQPWHWSNDPLITNQRSGLELAQK